MVLIFTLQEIFAERPCLFYICCDFGEIFCICNKIFQGSSEGENQVESIESGLDREAREADPARRQGKNQTKRKNQAKKKNQVKRKNQVQRKNQAKRKNKAEKKKKQAKRKNKKGKSNKRKGLEAKRGGKGKKGKRNNRKNGNKSGKGKKNRKAERNQKKKGKNKNMTGNQNRKNTGEARQCRVTTTCSDTAVAAHKLMKDKVDNFVKQHKRITKKTTIGSKKSNKNDVFKPVLQRLAAAAGGNISGKQPKILKEVNFIFDLLPSSCLCWKHK